MPQFAELVSSIQHTISLTATVVPAARQTLTYKRCFFSSPALRSCCIYAILSMFFFHTSGKRLWFLSPEARHSHNTPQMSAMRGNQRSLGSGRWGRWETRTMEHPSYSAHYDAPSIPTKSRVQPTKHRSGHCSMLRCRCGQHAQEEAPWDGLVSPCCIPDRDTLKLKKWMAWNIVLIMLIGALSLSSVEPGFLCRQPTRKSQYPLVFSYFGMKIRYSTYFTHWCMAVTVETLFNRVWKLLQYWLGS